MYLVQTNNLVLGVFMHLIKQVEEEENMTAPSITDANMILLSKPNILDDYPLVRKLNHNHSRNHNHNHNHNQAPSVLAKSEGRWEGGGGGGGEEDARFHLRLGKNCSPRDRESLRKIKRRGE
jgi:hypothetical protein